MKKTITVLITIMMFATMSTSIQKAQKVETTDLPSYFSWRDINGTDYTTPIRDQSPAPTCEAYGLCAVLETIMQYQMGEPYGPDLSETHLYFYAGGSYEAGYVHPIDAANYLIEWGVPDEGCYPDPHRAFDYPFESLLGWENRTVKIKEWGWVENEEESIKRALIEYGPLFVTFRFWRDFFYYHGGVYRHKWGQIAGGHAVAMVGYDDNEECWILKNSWGTGWGESGWFRIAYDADMIIMYGRQNGTGIMYLDGVYGNLKPDVPKVQIETPKNFHTYFFGQEFKTIFRQLLQEGAARIVGDLTVQVEAKNTNSVEFYIDDVKQHSDDEAPFTWDLQATRGLHTLEVRAYNDRNTSIDLIDFYMFF